MKNIELTEKHKSKLLEMCKELFPNDKIDGFQFGNIKFLINHYTRKDPNNSKITFEGWDKVLEIHWFEFCMIHLCDKIFDKFDKINYENINIQRTDFFLDVNIHNIHPIDYLYEKFKNL